MKTRIKGTNIEVKCLRIASTSNGQVGIECKYITGEYIGATEVIPGDCIIEC